jgi:hypothetical protein
MTRPLTLTAKAELEKADISTAWETTDLDRMRLMTEGLRDAYPMADIRLAQILVEIASGIQDVLNGPDDQLRSNLRGYQVSLMLLASAVSRKVRGKPEI